MRIILACAAGMSTSLLANNMQRVAQERGMDVTVEAMSTSSLDEAQWRSADVVLVGPQMRHLLPTLEASGAAYHVPVESIPPQDYATANAQHVLEQATTLAQNKAFHNEAGPNFYEKT
ncbi:MAG TPA: PTS sugar transporter subunit IIB [Armatimonadota bacterium]|jgi:PTS system cellobiose-specific IIB component